MAGSSPVGPIVDTHLLVSLAARAEGTVTRAIRGES